VLKAKVASEVLRTAVLKAKMAEKRCELGFGLRNGRLQRCDVGLLAGGDQSAAAPAKTERAVTRGKRWQ